MRSRATRILSFLLPLLTGIQGASASSHDGPGFNPLIILLAPISFLIIMLIFTYKTWYIPRQKEAKEKNRLREGLVLKNSTDKDKQQHAIALLEDLAADTDNSRPQIPILAKLSLLEFSLLRIKENRDTLEISTITSQLQELLKIAQNHFLHRVIVEIYIMQSKVALIEGDYTLHERLLSKAELLSEQKRFGDLLEKIEEERESYSTDEFKAGVKGLDRMDLTNQVNLDDQLFVAIQELKENYEGLPVETPVWMMMMNSSGVTLYSKKFLAGLYIDDQLFGGFITAINKFSKEVFGDDGHAPFKTVSSSIDYIKYGEFNLILKPVSNFLFCYVIKGRTDDAKHILEEISDDVRSDDEIWTSFQDFENTSEISATIENKITSIIENQLFVQ